MPTRDIKTRISLDGEKKFKSQMSAVNSNLKTMKSEMALVTSEFKGNANSVEALTAKDKILREEISQQEIKVKALEGALKDSITVYGEDSKQADAYRQQLNNAKVALNNMNEELDDNTKYLEEAEESTDGCATSIDAFGKEVKEAGEKSITFGDLVKANLASEAIVAGVKALAGAIKGAASALGGSIGETAEYGDSIDKMSQKLGMSAKAYQEWDFIMQHSGASIESLQPSMKKLQEQANANAEAFQELGISEEQVASMSREDLFAAVIEGLQGIDDEGRKSTLAMSLLGEGAAELGPLLNTSAEDTAAMRQQVNDLGGVMSNEAVAACAAYQDSVQNLQYAFDGMKNNLSAEFLPSVTMVMDGMTAVLSGDVDEGIAMIEEGVEAFGDKLRELGPYAQEALDLFTKVIIEALPTIVECAGEVIVSLIDGLAQTMPEMIPTIVSIILMIVDTLVDNIDLLIPACIQLIVGLATGLLNATPQLVAKLPEIIKAIVGGLVSAVPQLASAGVELINGLWNGIKGQGSAFKNKVAQWAKDSILTPVKNFFGIKSPSTLMRDQVGKNLAAGVEEGFAGELDVDGILEEIPSNFEIGAKLKAIQSDVPAGARSAAENSSSKPASPVIVHSQLVLDGKVIAETVDEVNTRKKKSGGK